MPKTNPIGTGTRNLSINAPVDWTALLGRVATRAGVSVGEFGRRMVERGLEAEDPAAAARLREIRKQYYGAAFLFIFSVSLVATWIEHDGTPQARACRRCPRRAGRFEECITIEPEAEA